MRLLAAVPALVVTAPAFASDLSPIAREAIADTVARMQQAVERADPGAYMLAVDPADPVFDEEQRKWAKDLSTHPIETVAFAADLDAAASLGGHAWQVPLTIRWTLPGEDTQRAVSLDAVFRPLGLPGGDWVFAGRVWREHPGENVRILTDPADPAGAEMAEYLTDHVGTFRAAIEADLGETLSMDPTIKIYPDMQSLQASIALSYTSPLGGWNEPGESIKLLSRDGFVGPRLDATVAHEIGHAVSFEWGDAIIDAPWWTLEGIAEVAADPFRGERSAQAADAAARLKRNNQLKEFAQLADFRGEAMNFGRQVYVQGRSMVRYITERFGRDARNDWFRAMGQNGTLDDATRTVLGVSFEQLDRDWRASLADG